MYNPENNRAMKKKNNLWYFETYQEIRDYAAEGFPSIVFYPKLRSAFVKDGQVVHPVNIGGDPVGDEIVEQGILYVPRQTKDVTVVGSLEDFPATDYAVMNLYRRQAFKAETPLDGFYQAAAHLASVLKAGDGERRTTFTAKEILVPEEKGGPKLVWPDKETVLYTVETPTGCYQAPGDQLFRVTDAMEKAEGVGPAKRRRFTVGSASDDGRRIVARLTFEADKVIPKMKKCWAVEDLRPIMMYPAVELKTGIMVCSNGHILVAHKTKGYHADVTGTPLFDTVLMPREVVQMKGTVTVTAEEKDGELVIVATDAAGKSGQVTQKGRFPNWRSVIPRQFQTPFAVDAADWSKAVKRILPNLPEHSRLMKMKAACGAEEIEFSGSNYDYDEEAKVSVSVPGGIKDGLWVGMKATSLLTTLSFSPERMFFLDPKRATLFTNADTLCLLMPMILDDEDKPDGPGRKSLVTFDLEKWIGPSASKPAKKARQQKPKVKAVKQEEASEVKAEPAGPVTLSLSEQLRQALRRRLAAAA